MDEPQPLFGIDDHPVFVIDQSRCIGCEACVQACQECGTHRGQSLIHLERVDRAVTTQTAPMVCMHCEDPTCAQVCPADAIKQTETGIVQSALKPRWVSLPAHIVELVFSYIDLPDVANAAGPDSGVNVTFTPARGEPL